MFGRGLGDTYAVFLLPLEREFGWTRSELTSVYSIYLLVHGCTAPLVGLVFDRFGPRWVYGSGMLSLGIAFFLAGSLTALWQFYLLVGVLVGVGVSMNGMVPGSALIARWYREKLSSALGVAYSAFGIGTVLFVPLVQYLVAEYDWRQSYRIMGSALLFSSHLAPNIDFPTLVLMRSMQTAGLAFLFVPISTIAYLTLPRELSGDGAALFSKPGRTSALRTRD